MISCKVQIDLHSQLWKQQVDVRDRLLLNVRPYTPAQKDIFLLLCLARYCSNGSWT
jgi:hypothetical protein